MNKKEYNKEHFEYFEKKYGGERLPKIGTPEWEKMVQDMWDISLALYTQELIAGILYKVLNEKEVKQ